MNNKGWISLHRKLADSDLWLSEKFTRGQAWADMILLANHMTGHVRVRGNKVIIQRGQLGWSIVKLAQRWHWSRDKVMRFLNELEDDKQISQQKNNISTIITITNYEQYQPGKSADKPTEEQQIGQQTSSRQVTNNNDKNKKNNKEVENYEVINEIYAAYPTTCPVQKRLLGKSHRDKMKIEILLREKSKEELLEVIRLYLADCVKTKSYVKNFSTFLNNLPDLEALRGGKQSTKEQNKPQDIQVVKY